MVPDGTLNVYLLLKLQMVRAQHLRRSLGILEVYLSKGGENAVVIQMKRLNNIFVNSKYTPHCLHNVVALSLGV